MVLGTSALVGFVVGIGWVCRLVLVVNSVVHGATTHALLLVLILLLSELVGWFWWFGCRCLWGVACLDCVVVFWVFACLR